MSQECDAKHQGAKDYRHHDEGCAGIFAARCFEGCDAVGNGLNAGEGRGAAGKSFEDQEEGDGLQNLMLHHQVHGGGGNHTQSARKIAHKANTHGHKHHHQEEVGGNGKSKARFFDAAQVDQHDQQHHGNRNPDAIVVKGRISGNKLGHAG